LREAGKDGKDEPQDKDGVSANIVGKILEGQRSEGEVQDPGRVLLQHRAIPEICHKKAKGWPPEHRGEEEKADI